MKRHGIYIIALLIILLAVINTVSAEDTNIDLIADNSNNDNVNINATDSVLKSSNEDCQFVSENPISMCCAWEGRSLAQPLPGRLCGCE